MSVLKVLAPRFSRRRLALSILRDFRYRPVSLIGRLAGVNFTNARTCAGLQMHCNVCGHDGGMSYDFPDVRIRREHGIGLLRETLRCKSCGATMRDRQLAWGLLQLIGARSGGQVPADLRSVRQQPPVSLRILDTDSFSPINRVLRGLPGYVHSQFIPSGRNGETLPDGSLNVNLEDMPFAEASFDIILTSDVMEHVLDDVQAHREIHRCLAAGGTYLFTAPYDPRLTGHHRLTQRTGQGASYFVLDRQIHGDPHSDSGIIAHRIYGRQIFDDLRAIGLDARFEPIDQPGNGVYGGDLFFAFKGH